MKYTESTKKQLKDIGISDITRKTAMVNDSGTSTGYSWDKTYKKDSRSWRSRDRAKNKAWVVIDVGKGGVAYVMFLKYSSSYPVKSVAISTADTPDASKWKSITTVETPSTTEDNAIPLGKNGKNKRFIKIQFLENDSFVDVEFFQVYGKIGDLATETPTRDSKATSDGKAPDTVNGMSEISQGIPCVDSSKVYDGYPIENMYKSGSGRYYCSANKRNVYLTFDCGTTKISQWQFVCFLCFYCFYTYLCLHIKFVCGYNQSS